MARESLFPGARGLPRWGGAPHDFPQTGKFTGNRPTGCTQSQRPEPLPSISSAENSEITGNFPSPTPKGRCARSLPKSAGANPCATPSHHRPRFTTASTCAGCGNSDLRLLAVAHTTHATERTGRDLQFPFSSNLAPGVVSRPSELYIDYFLSSRRVFPGSAVP